MSTEAIVALLGGGGAVAITTLVGFVGGIYFKAGKVVSELKGAKEEAVALRGELHHFAGKIESKMDSLTIILSGVENRVSVLETVVRLRGQDGAGN